MKWKRNRKCNFFSWDALQNIRILVKHPFFMTTYQHKTIYTIGHSTRPIEEFLHLLTLSKIELVVDIRRFPGSKKFPQYNPDNLKMSLLAEGIDYLAIEKLGGRRKVSPNSKNTIWRNPSFQGYADYMQTQDFADGIAELIKVASLKTTAIMCSEAVWWRCHRSMDADYLKSKGWEVLHIIGESQPKEHPYTAPAQIVNGQLTYET